MRYSNGVRVQIPYVDTEGKRNVALLNFNGDVDQRRVHREVRKFVKASFGKTVTKEWVQKVPKYILPNENVTPASDQVIEEWIQRIQCNEDEDESDSVSEGSTP